jgi:hypothetical protein
MLAPSQRPPDRASLLSFAAAFQREELVSLDVPDIEEMRMG